MNTGKYGKLPELRCRPLSGTVRRQSVTALSFVLGWVLALGTAALRHAINVVPHGRHVLARNEKEACVE
jgi:hypothetical protein